MLHCLKLFLGVLEFGDVGKGSKHAINRFRIRSNQRLRINRESMLNRVTPVFIRSFVIGAGLALSFVIATLAGWNVWMPLGARLFHTDTATVTSVTLQFFFFCGFFLRLFRLPRQARLGLFDRSRSFFSALTGFLGAAVRNNRRNFASGFADRLCGGNECAVFRLLRFVLLFVCHSLILTAIQALRAIQNAVSPDEPRNARRQSGKHLSAVRIC